VRLLAWLCILATILVVVYGIAQRDGYDFVIHGRDPKDRLFSSVGNPNMLAGFLVLMAWVAAGLALDSGRWWVRAGLGLLVVAMLWCLVRTYTKGAWIAMAASCLIGFTWFVAGWRFPCVENRRRRVAILAAAVAVAGLISLVAYRPIVGRLYTLKDSAAVRRVYWTGAAGMFCEHPVLGAGTGTFHVAYPAKRPPDFRAAGAGNNTLHAHCEPLEILAELGIVGLAAGLWVIVAFYRGVLRILSSKEDFPARGLVAGLAMGVSALLLHNLVDVNIRWPTTPTFFWVFLGLSAVMPHLNTHTPREEAVRNVPGGRFARWVMAIIFVAVLGGMLKTRVLDTWQSEVHYRTGHLLFERARWPAALDRHTRAIELDPSNLRARYEQAYCHYNHERYADGARSYLHLEQLAPNYCRLHYNLGIMYGLMGQWAEAVERFVKAQKSGAVPKGFSAAVRVAGICAKAEDGEKCVAAMRKVAELLPADPMAHVCLGNYYGDHDQPSQAAEEFTKALGIDDACIPALTGLAAIRFFQKDYSETIGLCERVLKINPRLHATRINLGRAYYLSGRREKAVAEWRRVVRENPSESEALECLKELGLSEKP